MNTSDDIAKKAAQQMPGLNWVDLASVGADLTDTEGGSFVSAAIHLGAHAGTLNVTHKFGEWLAELVIQAEGEGSHMSFARVAGTGNTLGDAVEALMLVCVSAGNLPQAVEMMASLEEIQRVHGAVPN